MFVRGQKPCGECHLWLCTCPEPVAAVECETDEPAERTVEDVEADVRVLMAKHAAIEPRGFDSIRERTVLHQRIDLLLDEHALRCDLAQVTA